MIPDLDPPGHREQWFRMEGAKRRLIYTLLSLDLPLVTRAQDPEGGLEFQFKSDLGLPEGEAVMTGHDNGVITVNLAEADDAERERRRVQLHEPYRTLLGHFRHEIGHYYWDRLIRDSERLDACRALLRRRDAGLRGGAESALRRRPEADVAGRLHHRLRELASLGGLGRDLGALPAHGRRPGDGGGVRPEALAAPRGRAGD